MLSGFTLTVPNQARHAPSPQRAAEKGTIHAHRPRGEPSDASSGNRWGFAEDRSTVPVVIRGECTDAVADEGH